ncbi:MAG: LCP family protein [Cyanobacteriota bacterium]|nr:LCP family protein [Cyanobacteriota bacterium]
MQPRPLPRSVRNRRAALRLASAGCGVVLGLAALAVLWPRADRSFEPNALTGVADLAKPPTRPVTVLLIGSDAERPGDPRNGAAPAGPANSDALMLLRVQPEAPLQLLELPIEAAVQLPGQKKPQALGSLYRQGGVALVADAVRELVALPPGQPDRYLVIGRQGLRQLIDALGELDVSPPRAMRYSDRSQKLTIDLQAGLQRLNGQQVEHMVRFRDPVAGEVGRRQQQQQLLRSLMRELVQPARLPQLALLARLVLSDSQTNLSEGELLSLLAAGLAQPDALEVTELPLEPSDPRHKTLRQLAPLPQGLPGWQDGL